VLMVLVFKALSRAEGSLAEPRLGRSGIENAGTDEVPSEGCESVGAEPGAGVLRRADGKREAGAMAGRLHAVESRLRWPGMEGGVAAVPSKRL